MANKPANITGNFIGQFTFDNVNQKPYVVGAVPKGQDPTTKPASIPYSNGLFSYQNSVERELMSILEEWMHANNITELDVNFSGKFVLTNTSVEAKTTAVNAAREALGLGTKASTETKKLDVLKQFNL